MKILAVGDQHHKLELPYASLFSDGRRSEWKSVVEVIHNTAVSCDAVVLMGDNLNLRNNPSSVLRDFVEFLKKFGDKPVHLLSGNHERAGLSTALDFLQKLEHHNWHVHTSITETKIGELKALMVPYLTPAMVGASSNHEGVTKAVEKFGSGYDLAFFHQAISGGMSNGTMVETFNEIVLPKEEVSKRTRWALSGHIHQPQFIPNNIVMTGSIFTSEVGEPGKNIYVYDTELEGKQEFPINQISLPVRGIYKVDWSNNPAEIFGGIPVNSIVKCIVTVPGTDIELVKETLKRFDASIIIEQYPRERTKVHFEEGGLDLSMGNLLKVYAETKEIDYRDLQEGLALLEPAGV